MLSVSSDQCAPAQFVSESLQFVIASVRVTASAWSPPAPALSLSLSLSLNPFSLNTHARGERLGAGGEAEVQRGLTPPKP